MVSIFDGRNPRIGLDPSADAYRGHDINRAMFDRDGDALFRSLAAFIATERIIVSDEAFQDLVRAIDAAQQGV